MYAAPESLFAAQFLGDTNILAATVTAVEGQTARCDIGIGEVHVPAANLSPGEQIKLSVRPEVIALAHDGEGFAGTIKDRAFIGNRIVYWVTFANGATLRCQEARSVAGMRFQPGSPVRAHWPGPGNVVLKS
jgi:ABC-type Fe3+/spermidine/putrescine transport system ATPase subunit